LNVKTKLFIAVPLLILVIGFASSQSVYSEEYEYWFWQKGVEVNAEPGENSAKTIFSIPKSKTNSNFKTLDYIFIFTDSGDFIRAGVVYESTVRNGYLTPVSFFYSDDKTHYLTLHPYRPSIENEVSIYYNNGWKISFLDTEVNYFQEFDAGWASGKSITYGGIALENSANEQTVISSCDFIGTIENIKDQKLFFGTNNGQWREPQIVRSGYEIYQQSISGNILLYQIPPPDFAYITETKSGYEIGFDCPKNQLEQTTEPETLITQLDISQKSQIPDWIKNTMKWYAEDKISEQEMINALQYLIKEGTIKLD